MSVCLQLSVDFGVNSLSPFPSRPTDAFQARGGCFAIVFQNARSPLALREAPQLSESSQNACTGCLCDLFWPSLGKSRTDRRRPGVTAEEARFSSRGLCVRFSSEWQETALPSRFAWASSTPLPPPRPLRGKRGFWQWRPSCCWVRRRFAFLSSPSLGFSCSPEEWHWRASLCLLSGNKSSAVLFETSLHKSSERWASEQRWGMESADTAVDPESVFAKDSKVAARLKSSSTSVVEVGRGSRSRPWITSRGDRGLEDVVFRAT